MCWDYNCCAVVDPMDIGDPVVEEHDRADVCDPLASDVVCFLF